MIPELEALKRLLLHEWDPIGVADLPEAADEYDAYAMQVFTSLNQGASETSVADYLTWLEAEHMGLSVTSGRSADIAKKVMQLHRETKQQARPPS